MPRVTEITAAGEDPILNAEFKAETEMFGSILNPSRVLAHRPKILQAAKRLYASFEEDPLLPASLLALVYARVASINGCPF